ncbi:MAG: hypothetical protein KKH25_02375, partial [Candidatus Omnitrophica bacterium]|nr:hypothetical protein [Candidatus Omnitrophota bacterium]
MIIEKTLLICPVCSRSLEDSGFRTVKYPTDLSRNSFLSKPHSILFCSSCGVGVAFPKLSDEQLLEFYSQSGYWNNSRVEVLLPRKFPGHYALSTARWRIIKPVIKKITKAISMLDIGAGQGFLGMVAAKDR